MKALTICQPYASLIACGEKLCENRKWPTSIRGRIAIHAGKSKAWLDTWPEDEMPDPMPFGAVIATANLTACVELSSVDYPDGPHAWLAEHVHAEGPFCFILDDVVQIEPFEFRGAQGFFMVPDHLIPANAR